MKTHFLCITLFFMGLLKAYAQSNVRITQEVDFISPNWQGQTTSFKVNNQGQWQLNAASGTSMAEVFYSLPEDKALSWEFWTQLSFSPSTSNYARVYLTGNLFSTADPNFQGVYVKIGGESGNTDAFDLYMQSGSTHTLMIKGKQGRASGSIVNARLKVVQDELGYWYMYSDTLGAHAYDFEGVSMVPYFVGKPMWGIHCQYSSTRRTNFIFDDFIFNTKTSVVQNVNIVNDSMIVFHATRKLSIQDFVLHINHVNYNVQGTWNDSDSSMNIILPTHLLQGKYEVTLQSINEAFVNDAIWKVDFFIPITHDKLYITELMSDPSSTSVTHFSEFVEIFNHSKDTLWLEGISLSDASSSCRLPNYQLPPSRYLVLCDISDTLIFKGLACIGLLNFPSLNNDEDSLYLRNNKNELLEVFYYNTSLFHNSLKADGAWSMEMLNINEQCKGEQNWDYTRSERGGTPGLINSYEGFAHDNTAPKMKEVRQVGNDRYEISWTESLVAKSVKSSEGDIHFLNDQAFYLTLKIPQGDSKLVTFTHVQDCLNNDTSLAFSFINPRHVKVGDVIINELLFNPYSFGKDYIELVNLTSEYIYAHDFIFVNGLYNGKSIDSIVFKPNEFKVFSEDSNAVILFYSEHGHGSFINLDLPTMNDDEGKIECRSNTIVLDKVPYSDSWHHPLLESKEGYALERIAKTGFSDAKQNWTSSSYEHQGGTPGFENAFASRSSEQAFKIDPLTISPTLSHYFNESQIQFPASPNALAKVEVFSSNGHFVNSLIPLAPLAAINQCVWNGCDRYGKPVATGLYVIIVDVMLENGHHERYKGTIGVKAE